MSERHPKTPYAFPSWPSHYGINALLYYTYTPAFAWRVANDTTVQDPVGTILRRDGLGVWVDWNDLTPTDDGRVLARHNGRVDVLWCDGHAKSADKTNLTGSAVWTPEED